MCNLGIKYTISIHALRKESDLAFHAPTLRVTEFQSTLSVRRATTFISLVALRDSISIHALRKESD